MIALIFCLHSVAHAVPMQMTHQGRLIDTNGAAISGVQSLTFTIFDDPNNGSDLWTETLTVAFNNGYFATVLGSDEITNPLDYNRFPTPRSREPLSQSMAEPSLLPRYRSVRNPSSTIKVNGLDQAFLLTGMTSTPQPSPVIWSMETMTHNSPNLK